MTITLHFFFPNYSQITLSYNLTTNYIVRRTLIIGKRDFFAIMLTHNNYLKGENVVDCIFDHIDREMSPAESIICT